MTLFLPLIAGILLTVTTQGFPSESFPDRDTPPNLDGGQGQQFPNRETPPNSGAGQGQQFPNRDLPPNSAAGDKFPLSDVPPNSEGSTPQNQAGGDGKFYYPGYHHYNYGSGVEQPLYQHQFPSYYPDLLEPIRPVSMYHPIVRPNCPPGFYETPTRCLWVEKLRKSTWNNALSTCREHGLSMLEVKTGNCYVEVVEALEKYGLKHSSYWVAATNVTGTGWTWISDDQEGAPIPDAFWVPSFNNFHGESTREVRRNPLKTCAYIDHDRFFFMNADYCTSGKKVICTTDKKVDHPARPYYHILRDGKEKRGSRSVGEGSQEEPQGTAGTGEIEETREEGSGETGEVEEATGNEVANPEEIEGTSEIHTCGEDWEHFEKDEHCYQLNNKTLPFSSALQTCRALNAELATPSSAEENAFLVGLLDDTISVNASVWIGLSSRDHKFVWIDLKPFSFSNWQDDQPDNHQNIERCVDLLKEDGLWSDSFCGHRKRFVCERKPATVEAIKFKSR